MIQRGLQAEGTLIKLTLFLVAHRHVVKELQCDKLVSFAAVEVHGVQHAVGFLQQ
jgi:hypothetical protein